MKILFAATVMVHFKSFHLPYMKWFQEQGWEVHVVANDDIEIPYVDKKHILPIERSPFNLRNLDAYKKLRELLSREEYDIIHCHTPMGGVLTRLAARAVKKGNTRVIYTAHGFHFFKGAPLINWLIYYPIESWLARYTDTLITINKEDYATAKEFKAKEVVYVPGVGVDVERFNGESVNRKAKRKELGIPDNAVSLLSVGELSKRKNHEVVIKALSRLNNPNIYYIICGQGNLESYLKGVAKELNVNVKFLGYREDIPDICATIDLYVFPSYQEGLPVALMEAMSAGLPVVCSNIRGNTDLIKDGQGGYLVAPDDIEGFSKSIGKLLKDNVLQKKMGIRNVEEIKKYDKKVVKEQMQIIYADCKIKRDK